MNWAASHLVNRKELQEVVQNRRLLRPERGRKKFLARVDSSGKVTFPWWKAGAYQADDLPSID